MLTRAGAALATAAARQAAQDGRGRAACAAVGGQCFWLQPLQLVRCAHTETRKNTLAFQ